MASVMMMNRGMMGHSGMADMPMAPAQTSMPGMAGAMVYETACAQGRGWLFSKRTHACFANSYDLSSKSPRIYRASPTPEIVSGLFEDARAHGLEDVSLDSDDYSWKAPFRQALQGRALLSQIEAPIRMALPPGARLVIVPAAMRVLIEELDDYFAQHRVAIAFLPTQFGEQFLRVATKHGLRAAFLGGSEIPFTGDGFQNPAGAATLLHGQIKEGRLIRAFGLHDVSDSFTTPSVQMQKNFCRHLHLHCGEVLALS